MKSVRKPVVPFYNKQLKDSSIQSAISSLPSVRAAVEDQSVADDWLPVQLSEVELDEDLTRIMNGNNPRAPKNITRYNYKDRNFKTLANTEHIVFHFELDGYLTYSADDVVREVDKSVGDAEVGPNDSAAARNQFYFSERAVQTINCPVRERATNTVPPPQHSFSHNVSQWSIYDDYIEDELIKERASKEKAKGSAGVKGQKDVEKSGSVISKSTHLEDLYYKSPELREMMHIAERMANQNTYDEVAQDYKYWDDVSDKMEDKKTGTLLPLWKFTYQPEKKKEVTALCWSPEFTDLLVIGYGTYDFSNYGPGIIACFSLKNPSHPEFQYQTSCGVMSIHIHPRHPSMVAVGLHDGSVLVYDIKKKTDQPLFKSSGKDDKHSDPVWQVCWQNDNLDDNLVFYSVSSDGRVIQWTLLKNEMIHTDIVSLVYDHKLSDKKDEEDQLFSLAGGCCFDFHSTSEHLFVVGTEEGKIYKCSKEFGSQNLLQYEGHSMSVYMVKYNPFNPDYFISCSADWSVKIWDQNFSEAVMTFDLNSSVSDIAWAPYSSTIFAAVTVEGKVFLFDISIDKSAPLCEQQISRKSRLTNIRFNPTEPVLLVGDDFGQVVSLKLSPNLRKKGVDGDEESHKLQMVINLSKGVPNL